MRKKQATLSYLSGDTQPQLVSPEGKPTTRIIAAAIFCVLLVLSSGIAGCSAYQNSQRRGQVLRESPTLLTSTSTPLPTKSPTLKTPFKNTPTATTIQKGELSIPNEWETFTSHLGFSFKYPAEWGEATEEIVDAVQSGTGDSGSIYRLNFSNYTAFGSGQSADYSASRGATDTDFRGYSDRNKRIIATVYARPATCYIPFSAYRYYAWIDFNLPGRQISGVRLLLPLLSDIDIEAYDKEYEKQNPEGNTCEPEMEAEQWLEEAKKKNLDQKSMRNISIFKRILSSSKILP